MYIDDSSDTSIANHWTKDTHQTLTDGSRVYRRTRSTTPPMFMQEMFHRIKPIDMAHHRMKRQAAADRRFDPAKFQKAMDLQKAKRNSATAEVRSAAELKVLLFERCSVRLGSGVRTTRQATAAAMATVPTTADTNNEATAPIVVPQLTVNTEPANDLPNDSTAANVS